MKKEKIDEALKDIIRKMLGMSRPDAPKTEVGRGGKTVIVQDTQSKEAKRAKDYTTPEGEQAGLKGPTGETRTQIARRTDRDLKKGGKRRNTPPQITSDGTAHEGPSIKEISVARIRAAAKAVRGKSEREVNWNPTNLTGGKSAADTDVAQSVGQHMGRTERDDKRLKKLLYRKMARDARKKTDG